MIVICNISYLLILELSLKLVSVSIFIWQLKVPFPHSTDTSFVHKTFYLILYLGSTIVFLYRFLVSSRIQILLNFLMSLLCTHGNITLLFLIFLYIIIHHFGYNWVQNYFRCHHLILMSFLWLIFFQQFYRSTAPNFCCAYKHQL